METAQPSLQILMDTCKQIEVEYRDSGYDVEVLVNRQYFLLLKRIEESIRCMSF